jgi:hypothetical protein
VLATHQRWDGLAGSRSPPVRDPDCDREVASGRAMVTAYPWGNSQLNAASCGALFEAVHHPPKTPAVQIDVFAVERLLRHKRPRRVHIRHISAKCMVASSSHEWHSRDTAASALLCLGYAADVRQCCHHSIHALVSASHGCLRLQSTPETYGRMNEV